MNYVIQGPWRRARRAVMFASTLSILLAAAGSRPAVATDPGTDKDSTPQEQQKKPAGATAALVGPAPASLTSGSVVTGLNFEASRLFVDSGFIPPDTMGSVGPNHIVVLINGNFEVFNKATGASLGNQSLDSFWTNVVGLTIPSFNDTCDTNTNTCTVSGDTCTSTANCRRNRTGDPKIVFDHASNRWFATSFDSRHPVNGDNNLYVARTDTDDPTGDWDGVIFDLDTVGAGEFHDYPQMGLDADGLYVCTQDCNPGCGANESCYSIPKADLLLAAPSVANLSRFEATPAGLTAVDGSFQPVVDFGPSDGRAPIYGTSGGSLVRSSIIGAGGAGATLDSVSSLTGDPGHATPPDARQPHPAGRTIENVAPRFVAYLYEQGDSVWGVHAVAGSSSNSALRWYQLNEVTDTVIQTGLIEDPDVDFHEPSIAADEHGHVVIGYTCSGPNRAPSSCVSVGETINGVTTFDPPRIVQLGAGHYWEDFNNPPNAERNRWGDYSATVQDPTSECGFWTFQEFVAVSAVGDVGPSPLSEGGQWGLQVTQLTVAPPVITIPGDLFFDDVCVDGGGVQTLEVCNTTANSGPCANLVVTGITSSNPQFTVTTPSSGFPVTISPDFCFPFQVRFTPTSSGPQSTTLTVASSDPVTPSVTVQASGTGTVADVRVTGSTTFGDVCPGSLAEKSVSVCNVGECNLSVASVAFNPPCPDFTLVNNPFPAAVSPDSCQDVIIRFTPTSAGPKTCTLVVTTDDPDTSVIMLTVTANTPAAIIDVPPDQGFPPTVISSTGACSSANPFPVSNTGTCNLTISALGITTNPAEFSISGLPSFPIILEPGHIAGEGDLANVFAPDALGRARAGAVTVTYVSDPITGATTDITRALCGEGVRTGARVLATAGGVPLASVEQIKLHRINANRNKNLLDSIDNARNLPLQTVIPGAPCGPFQYHREYGTVSNPIQLLPGSYQVTVTAIVNGKRTRRTVGFDVGTCGFNPNIVVAF